MVIVVVLIVIVIMIVVIVIVIVPYMKKKKKKIHRKTRCWYNIFIYVLFITFFPSLFLYATHRIYRTRC